MAKPFDHAPARLQRRAVLALLAATLTAVLVPEQADAGVYTAVQCHPSFSAGRSDARFTRSSGDYAPTAACRQGGAGFRSRTGAHRPATGAPGHGRSPPRPGPSSSTPPPASRSGGRNRPPDPRPDGGRAAIDRTGQRRSAPDDLERPRRQRGCEAPVRPRAQLRPQRRRARADESRSPPPLGRDAALGRPVGRLRHRPGRPGEPRPWGAGRRRRWRGSRGRARGQRPAGGRAPVSLRPGRIDRAAPRALSPQRRCEPAGEHRGRPVSPGGKRPSPLRHRLRGGRRRQRRLRQQAGEGGQQLPDLAGDERCLAGGVTAGHRARLRRRAGRSPAHRGAPARLRRLSRFRRPRLRGGAGSRSGRSRARSRHPVDRPRRALQRADPARAEPATPGGLLAGTDRRSGTVHEDPLPRAPTAEASPSQGAAGGRSAALHHPDPRARRGQADRPHRGAGGPALGAGRERPDRRGRRLPGSYRFHATTERRTYRFRALVPRQAGYPYARGTSRTKRKVVRGEPR